MDDANALPDMPESGAGGRGQLLESSASMAWTLTFLAYSSSSFLSEFGRGRDALWTLFLVYLPPFLASLHAILLRDTRAVAGALAYLAYVLAPAAAAALPLPRLAGDLAVLALLWLPLEARALPQIGPTGRVSIWASLTAALAAVNMFCVLRPFDERGVGYSFKLGPVDVLVALVGGAFACACAMPLGVSLRYGRPRALKGLRFGPQAAIFGGMYFGALGEEILFRGIAQNAIEHAYGRHSLRAVLIADVLYAAAHFKNKAQGFPQPNWRAAVVALLTGLSYGMVWRVTGKVTASAISHTMVDYSIRTFLQKPAE